MMKKRTEHHILEMINVTRQDKDKIHIAIY